MATDVSQFIQSADKESLFELMRLFSSSGRMIYRVGSYSEIWASWGQAPQAPAVLQLRLAFGTVELQFQEASQPPISEVFGLIQVLVRVERRIVCQRLHKTVCQELTAAKLELELYAFEAAPHESLSTTKELLTQAAVSVRDLLQELSDEG